MATKVYVGNLGDETTEEQLEQLFKPYGRVAYTEVIIELTGRGKSFGFVEMASADAARRAILELNGRAFGDQRLVVSAASAEEEVAGPIGSGAAGGFE